MMMIMIMILKLYFKKLSKFLRESIEQLIKDNSSSSSNQMPHNISHPQSLSSSSSSSSFNNSDFPNNLASFVESTYNLKSNNSINNNTNSHMKMFGDVSSMVSLLAAAAAASNTNNKQQVNSSFSNMSFQFNPSQIQMPNPTNSISQDFNSPINTQVAAMAVIQKYNSLYSNIHHQQQQQQQNNLQQNCLAKYMSLCYNKPADYIQKFLAEQNNAYLKDTGLNSQVDAQEGMINHQQKNIFNLVNGQQKSSSTNMHRYHPYKNNSSKIPITVITNNGDNSDGDIKKQSLSANSPPSSVSGDSGSHLKKLSLMNKQINKQPNDSRSPSPISSVQSSPVQKLKDEIGNNSRPPSTPASNELSSPNSKKKL